MGYDILLRFASIEPSLTEVNCGSLPLGVLFSFSPDPLLPALPCLRASNNPPPPGRGTSKQVSVRNSRRRHNQPASRHISSAYSLRSFAIARSCPFLLASVRPYSIPTAFCSSTASRSPSRRPIRKTGRGFRLASSPPPPPASIDIGKAGRGCRIAGLSPSRLFRLSCLLAAFSFPYKPGMVMGYSVATVIYFS